MAAHVAWHILPASNLHQAKRITLLAWIKAANLSHRVDVAQARAYRWRCVIHPAHRRVNGFIR